MIICALKLTHDASLSVFEDNRLVFSVELEKLDNNPRYQKFDDLSLVPEILTRFGYDINQIDKFLVDGWEGIKNSCVAIKSNGKERVINVASYRESTVDSDLLEAFHFSGLCINGKNYDYSSYYHLASHVVGTYMCSPFAKAADNSYVLVWDGGTYPRLYYVDAQQRKITNYGHLLLIFGNVYTLIAQQFPPFKTASADQNDLSIAGKLMAYIARGKVRAELFELFDDCLACTFQPKRESSIEFVEEIATRVDGTDLKSEDVLASFHQYLSHKLLTSLKNKVAQLAHSSSNLCITGGCGLNIKWNSDIRSSGVFNRVWVPPFPNDSGTGIGVAACYLFSQTTHSFIEWDVYCGCDLIQNEPYPGWSHRPCSVKELAQLLYESDEPVVFLNGRAETGPRALGNRSILASARSAQMKKYLNDIKHREDYRPVAPVCLESHASEYFIPGGADPYMIFDHTVKDEWVDKIPAICHLDGTARLQTVSYQSNPILFELLTAFYHISGVALLCNTSANLNGRGFFPDIHSATKWQGCQYVWSGGNLYSREK